ncbi:MAG: CPBP family intramembrane metalloprotease [Myxococcales bacterium]|nr:CPBP family intramembrane metalloprotease [Myxococcales bacterium]
MIDAARELWTWTVENRWVLFLATVAAFSQLQYEEHGPPARLLVLPSLAIIVFLVIPWVASVLHDVRDKLAVFLAVAAGVVVLVPNMYWAHFPGGRKELIQDPTMLVLGAGIGLLLVIAASWRGNFDAGAWGLGLGDVKWWSKPVVVLLVLIGVGIPLTAYFFPEFIKYYPRYRPSRIEPNVVALLQYQLAMGIYMFCWEYFFRGFMLFGLARTTGPVAAIIIQAYPFFLLHDAKPEPELISSWFGGILVGWLAWRGKSAWPSFLLHWIMYSTMEVSAFVGRHYLGLVG